MGNREALIEGAKTCLVEKGYTGTTARDIATAAGVSLAAIGYHFRSKDELMNVALGEAMEEWGEQVGRELAAAGSSDGGPGLERFRATWAELIESLGSNRALWITQFEILGQLGRNPGLGKSLIGFQSEAREGLATLFGWSGDDPDLLALGGLYQAMLIGVAGLWLLDPGSAPSPESLAQALRRIEEKTE